MSSPKIPHSVASECPEQDMMSSGGQIPLQAVEAQEIHVQASSVRASRIISTTQCTSSLPLTTMSSGIQVSQTLQQISHYSEPSTSSAIQPWYRHQPAQNQQPPPPAHQQSRMNKQLLNEPFRPASDDEDPLLLCEHNPFTSGTQSGAYHQSLYNNPILSETYPGGPAQSPYYPSQPLDLSQHSTGILSITPRCQYQWVLSENITRNVTCRPLTEETMFPAHQQTAYNIHNREVHSFGFDPHLQQSQQQQSIHHPQSSSVHPSLPIQGIQAFHNQPMYQTVPSLPELPTQLQPCSPATHNIQAVGLEQNAPLNQPRPVLLPQSLTQFQKPAHATSTIQAAGLEQNEQMYEPVTLSLPQSLTQCQPITQAMCTVQAAGLEQNQPMCQPRPLFLPQSVTQRHPPTQAKRTIQAPCLEQNEQMYEPVPSLLHQSLTQCQPITKGMRTIQAAGFEQNQQMFQSPPQLSTQSLSETQPGMSYTNRGTLNYKICIKIQLHVDTKDT